MTQTSDLPPTMPSRPPRLQTAHQHTTGTSPPIQLVRSRDDRILAGVCGGIAGRLRIDAVIVRVLVVVLSFFGGAGVLLYALGWLLLPVDDGRGRSELEDAFDSRTQDRARHMFTVVALIAAIGASSLVVLSGSVVPGVLVVLAAVCLLVLARRDAPSSPWTYEPRPGGPPRSSEPGASAQPPAAYGPAAAGANPPPGGPSQPLTDTRPSGYGDRPATTGVTARTGPEATTPLGSGPESSATASTTTLPPSYVPPGEPAPPATRIVGPPYDPPYGGWPGPSGTPPGPPPSRQRDRSHLGLLTVSVCLLALGVLAAVDISTAQVPGSAYVALALGVVGLGLLVGAWFGRSRGLIALGLVLGAALVPAVVLDTATDGDWSELRSWGRAETTAFVPTTVAEIDPTYEIGSGTFLLDLRGVDFAAEDVTTNVDAGAGEVVVLVPAEVDVSASAELGIGELDLFGYSSGGIGLARSLRDVGTDGLGGGQLDLTVDANIGRVEVRREAA